MNKYAIWDKKSPILTPSGAVFTAEQWMEKYPVAALDSVTVVCAAGEINGAIFGTLNQMIDNYTDDYNLDFSLATTPEEAIAIINEYELQKKNEMEQIRENAASNAELTAASLASIAASMEFQNMMALEDVEV